VFFCRHAATLNNVTARRVTLATQYNCTACFASVMPDFSCCLVFFKNDVKYLKSVVYGTSPKCKTNIKIIRGRVRGSSPVRAHTHTRASAAGLSRDVVETVGVNEHIVQTPRPQKFHRRVDICSRLLCVDSCRTVPSSGRQQQQGSRAADEQRLL